MSLMRILRLGLRQFAAGMLSVLTLGGAGFDDGPDREEASWTLCGALQIERMGPDFMLITPGKDGDFTVTLQRGKLPTEKIGLVVSCAATLFALVGSIIKAARARVLG